MKTTLIFIGSLAVILGIFAYFAVFGPPTGSYVVSPVGSASDTSAPSLVLTLASSTTATTTPLGVAPVSSTTPPSTFGTAFATPPLTWPQGNSKISINAVSLEDTQMTFTLSVQIGAAPECVPLSLSLVADEQGDLDPPTPASFTFPDSGNCNGTPNEVYENQTTTFTVDPTAFPLLFTTGGASNIFFEVVTSTNNGLNVVFPGTSG